MRYKDLLRTETKESHNFIMFLCDCDPYLQEKYLDLVEERGEDEIPENTLIGLRDDNTCPCCVLKK